MFVRAVTAALVIAAAALPAASVAEPLALEAKIPLGDVAGRIDHLAIDLKRQRLLVAELGNDTVGVVDLAGKRVARRMTGLKEPQGVAYADSADLIYVANGDDGTVVWFEAADFTPAGRVKLGRDADNLRFDRTANEVVAGYGSGALAILDAASGTRKAEVRLPAHPEAFQLAPAIRIFVNVPDAQQIAVVDRAAGRQIAQWGIEARGNFPMVLDAEGGRLMAVYRSPPTLAVFDTMQGTPVAAMRTCDDADDVFFDRLRKRIYISCGDGAIAVVQQDGNNYHEMARVKTNAGARTSLFVPELDRLFLAVRARGHEPAAIWVYRPDS